MSVEENKIGPRNNLLILVSGLNHGGAEQQVCRIAPSLGKRGWNVSLATMLEFPEEIVLDPKIPVHRLGMERRITDIRGAVRAAIKIREIAPDFIITFNYPANIMGRLLKPILGKTIVVTSIRNEKFGSKWREKAIKWTDKLGDITTTNSELVAKSLVDRGIVRPGRMKTISNAFHFKDLRKEDAREVRRTLGVSESDFFWLAIGRIAKQKDYGNLLDAVSYCRRNEGPPFVVKIAGQGDLPSDILDRLSSCDLHQTVEFIGLRKDIPSLLAGADGVVMSSAWEGLPNALIEAHGASKPVVATDVGGVSEVVINGQSGIIVPKQDPIALSDGMNKIMALTAEERQQMGRVGMDNVMNKFDIDIVVDEWDRLLRGLRR